METAADGFEIFYYLIFEWLTVLLYFTSVKRGWLHLMGVSSIHAFAVVLST